MLYEMTLYVHIIKHSGVWFWTNGVAAIKKKKKEKKKTSGHGEWGVLVPKPNKTSNAKSCINQSLKSDW